MYSIETKFILFKIGCYKFKMLTVIPKVTSKKITKKWTDKKKDENPHDALQKKIKMNMKKGSNM